jgi:hypothetical protein
MNEEHELQDKNQLKERINSQNMSSGFTKHPHVTVILFFQNLCT